MAPLICTDVPGSATSIAESGTSCFLQQGSVLRDAEGRQAYSPLKNPITLSDLPMDLGTRNGLVADTGYVTSILYAEDCRPDDPVIGGPAQDHNTTPLSLMGSLMGGTSGFYDGALPHESDCAQATSGYRSQAQSGFL